MSKDPAEAIRRVVRAIPAGQVASYGQVAEFAGLPRRARLVGRVLRAAPSGELPWHRVLRADGRIAFPEDSVAHREQVARLAAEGVIVRNGRVDLGRHRMTVDALLWGPPEV